MKRSTRTVPHPRWPGHSLGPQDRRVVRDRRRKMQQLCLAQRSETETPFMRAIREWRTSPTPPADRLRSQIVKLAAEAVGAAFSDCAR